MELKDIFKINNWNDLLTKFRPYYQLYSAPYNLTNTDCGGKVCTGVENMILNEDWLTIRVNKSEYYFVEHSENNYWFGSVAAQFLYALEKKVKKKVHVVIDNKYKHFLLLFNSSKYITTRDISPYDFEEINQRDDCNCSRPFTVFNQLSMISPVIERSYHDSYFKVFNVNVWVFIFSLIVFLALFSLIETRGKKSSNLCKEFFKSCGIYFLPLLREGNNRKPMTLTYLFCLIAIVPIVEIFRNDLFATFVSVLQEYDNNIDDLLRPERKVATFNEKYYDKFRNNLLKNMQITFIDDYVKLKEKLKLIDLEVLKLIKRKEDAKKLITKLTFIEDDYSMKTMYEALKDKFKIKMGKEKYLKRLISSVCFRFNGYDRKYMETFIEKVNEISLITFETGFSDFWIERKIDFYKSVILIIINIISNDKEYKDGIEEIINFLEHKSSPWTPLTFYDVELTVYMCAVLCLLSLIILMVEFLVKKYENREIIISY